LPAEFPSTSEFRELADNPTEEDKQQITELGRSFGKTWTPELTRAIPDQSFLVTVNRKFLAGKVFHWQRNFTGYSVANQYREIFRAGYQAYDKVNDHPDTSYYFNDDNYSAKTKLNGLFNWLFVFGNNQRIEFRNFFNQISDKTTVLREGRTFMAEAIKLPVNWDFNPQYLFRSDQRCFQSQQQADQPGLDPWIRLYQQTSA